MEEAWKKAQNNIFRLESIPEYNVPEDFILFKKWKQGKLKLAENSKKWLQNLKETKERGVKMQRVRIVSLPLSDYIRYEMDFWEHSIQNGEEILFLENEQYENIMQNLDFKPKDFWTFDDNVLIIFHYDETGDFVKEESISNKLITKKYIELKRKLLKYAISMNEFLKTKAVAKN